jgi:Suppressor of fused protein (SUFU)
LSRDDIGSGRLRDERGGRVPDQPSEDWFENAWAVREENVYHALFGDIGPGIYPLDADLFTKVFHQESIDPRWVTHGVFACPANATRPNWLYVSSGLSNAWDAASPNPDVLSGLGSEFLLECPQQSNWALALMRRMVAFQILLSVGRFPGKNILALWDRIPLRGPIDGASSALTWVMLAPSQRFAGEQQLPSGRFQFMQFIGITEDEAEYARRSGGDNLLALLGQRNAASVTDPKRLTVL